MTYSNPDSLALSRRVLRILIKLNLLMGALILALLIASLLNEPWVMRALGAGPSPGSSRLIMAMRLIMVLGICATPIVHLVLARLLTIVDTVSVGNPFIVANADRLKTIAWAILALELMHFAVGMVAQAVSSDAAQYQLGLLPDAMARGADALRAGAGLRAGRTHARRSRRDGLTMSIIVKLDDMLHERRMTLTELSEKIGITLANLSDPENRKGARHPILHARGHLRGTRVPAG